MITFITPDIGSNFISTPKQIYAICLTFEYKKYITFEYGNELEKVTLVENTANALTIVNKMIQSTYKLPTEGLWLIFLATMYVDIFFIIYC